MIVLNGCTHLNKEQEDKVMEFTLRIKTDSKHKDIKKKCCEVLAEFLKKEGYFSVEFDPNEIDIDGLGKA